MVYSVLIPLSCVNYGARGVLGGELRQPSHDQRPSVTAKAPSEAPEIASSAVLSAREALRSARLGAPSPPVAAVGESGDFVARALVILANETEAWRIRRDDKPSQGSDQ